MTFREYSLGQEFAAKDKANSAKKAAPKPPAKAAKESKAA
jgi:hypothetical protein